MGDNWYRFAVAAVEAGALQATGGIRVVADGGLELLADADMIIIPGWRGVDEPVPEMLCEALRETHQRGTRLVSICSGVFVLPPQAFFTSVKRPPTGATLNNSNIVTLLFMYVTMFYIRMKDKS